MNKEIPKRDSREFLGKISGFTDKADANLNKKMLRAYILGSKRFQIGRDSETKQPIYAPVPQRYFQV